MILRSGRRQLTGIGDPFTLASVFASPGVQQAATATAGNALQAVGQGLLSIFGDDEPPPAPVAPPPPKPGIPTPLLLGGLAALGVGAYFFLKD